MTEFNGDSSTSDSAIQIEVRKPSEAKTFSIGELSREFGVTLRALRFYEDRGLLHPMRQGQTRLYSSKERQRLDLLLLGKRIGMSLTEIREILEFYAGGEPDVETLKMVRQRFDHQLGQLETRKLEVNEAISELTQRIRLISESLGASAD